MNLLLVEDDPAMRLSLTRSLERRGLRVQAVADGPAALDLWPKSQADVVLLDLSLPGMDGLDVLARGRAAGLRTPVLILTARGTVGDRILGLNVGADDYLPKPFDLDELFARIQALGRRAGTKPPSAAPATPAPSFCGMRHDPDSGAVYHEDEVLELTPREAALLRALLARPGHAIAKERLFELVFAGELDVQLEAIEVVAYRLRKRIAHTGAQLVTLRGLGYLLKAQG
ncbi:MAG: response regulator transcription factor [Roseateles asaccharophilus]|jgi:two-component system response regulator TctD|uniref:Two-component system response regulator TctD n=1 Tax=Roseateles asaccharophilus TaxID=582607 RepID=A0A4R6NAW6_9BURK|nr:response regulator transcription factor [Roseateles asaccharophilus]MDN3543848.1 response regulator transcription factor [Roseateles asaccharophilus]TDP11774.1 two-component system response regulator TctD [Roseateles asaccharophilus]